MFGSKNAVGAVFWWLLKPNKSLSHSPLQHIVTKVRRGDLSLTARDIDKR